MLSVNPGFTGTITAEYAFTTAPTREIDFEYDHNGLRTQKKVVENGITTIYDYTLHGKLITHLTKRVVDLDGVETSEELHFFYDAQSRPAFVEFEGDMYRYIHNLQGDIVAIVDSIGNPVVEYKYDAWGKHVGTVPEIGIGAFNPFRYRGYAWDVDLGLFYQMTRYYNPDVCRFISSDIIIANMRCGVFVYARNSPIVFKDSEGMLPEYTDIVVYLDTDEKNGVHWQIQIFDVVISHGKNGYTALPPESCEGYTALALTNVPRETAEKGMDYLLSLCRPDLISEYKKQDDLYKYFEKKGWFNKPVKASAPEYEYNVYSHPCASIIEGAYEAIGLKFSAVWASIRNPHADSSQKGKPEYSLYLISRIFLKRNPLFKKNTEYVWSDVMDFFGK